MFLSRLAVPAAAAAAVLVSAGPAAANPVLAETLTSTFEGAHVWFESPNGAHNLQIDLEITDGQALLDIEWFTVSCQDTEDGSRICRYQYRDSYDVSATMARFSLDTTVVTAAFSYDDLVRTCTYPAPNTEVGPCAEERSTGATTLDVTWTGVGEISHSERTDSAGIKHISDSRGAVAAGIAFDTSYPAELSLITQLARSVTVA